MPTIKRIEKINLGYDSLYYRKDKDGDGLIPDSIEEHTKQALLRLQDKLNEIIDTLNSLLPEEGRGK